MGGEEAISAQTMGCTCVCPSRAHAIPEVVGDPTSALPASGSDPALARGGGPGAALIDRAGGPRARARAAGRICYQGDDEKLVKLAAGAARNSSLPPAEIIQRQML